jgi:hypothetical protein
MFDHVAADFTLPYAVVARITIEPVTMNAGMMQSTIKLLSHGRGSGPIIYVVNQDLYYDSIVLTELPPQGPFQELFGPGTNGPTLSTEFGPGDPGYVGGRWVQTFSADLPQYFSCPLLGPGREAP